MGGRRGSGGLRGTDRRDRPERRSDPARRNARMSLCRVTFPNTGPCEVLGLAGVTTCVFVSYLRSVSVVRRAVVLALIALAVSACGGSRHVAFSRFTTVGELSVPTPPGFHHRSWPGGGHGQQ